MIYAVKTEKGYHMSGNCEILVKFITVLDIGYTLFVYGHIY